MKLFLENETDKTFDFDVNDIAENVIKEVLTEEQCPFEVEVNLLLTSNDSIRTYNRETREIDKATDVLSFPNLFFEKEAVFDIPQHMRADYTNPETGLIVLGDIIISTEKIAEQALAYGHSEKREFAFLVAHSMLHLCGYDHMSEHEAKVMEQKQEQILQKLMITRECS